MKRRNFFPFLLTPALAGLPANILRAKESSEPMKIDKIETVYWRDGSKVPWQPNWTWVRVHTNTGLVGLGETYPRNEAEASFVHGTAAGLLLGKDPRDIDRIWASDEVVIITIVGAGMSHTPGIAGRIFGCLGDQAVNVIAIAQGSSEVSISLVVDRADEEKALQSLHALIVKKPLENAVAG